MDNAKNIEAAKIRLVTAITNLSKQQNELLANKKEHESIRQKTISPKVIDAPYRTIKAICDSLVLGINKMDWYKVNTARGDLIRMSQFSKIEKEYNDWVGLLPKS